MLFKQQLIIKYFDHDLPCFCWFSWNILFFLPVLMYLFPQSMGAWVWIISGFQLLVIHSKLLITQWLYSLLACQAGVSPLLQHQFEELAKQNTSVQTMGDNKRRKLAAFGQDLTEPLQALRTGGQQVSSTFYFHWKSVFLSKWFVG